MSVLLIGLNHNSAAVSVRERVAFGPDQLSDAVQQLASLQDSEASILSTCNRTELLLARDSESPLEAEAVIQWLHEYHRLPAGELDGHLYLHMDVDAVGHIMQVAAGLDSLVLGEPQILGQLKSAYALARECGTVGAVLNRLYQRVFAAAKRVRTETAIGENPVSVAYAAVDLAGRIYESMASVNVLLVGAGETIELVGTHLRQAGVNRMLIANRSLDRGLSLAKKLGAEACVLGDLPEVLPQVDIVVSSTASQLPIIGKGLVETALRKRRHEPMLFIDIAVPRDVESEVAELHDVYLYTVDDLRDIVDQNRAQRETEANKAREILNQELVLYTRSRRADASKPWIKYYRDQAFALTDLELERARKELSAGADPAAVLDSMARAITNKLIHAPSQGLRSIAERNVAELDVAKRLLGLPDELDQ